MKAGLTILFILSVFTGYSQSITFNVANPFWLYPINKDVVEIGNYYYCLGSYNNNGKQVSTILKYDSNGNLIQTKEFSDTIHYESNGILKSSRNTLYVTLSRYYYIIFDGYAGPVVLELDTNLSVLKEKIFPIRKDGYGFIPIEKDNSLFMTGYTPYDSNWDTLPVTPHGGPDYNFLFWKMDTSFNDLIYKSAGTEWMDISYRIIESFDTTLLLAGWTDGFPPYNVTGLDRRDWYLINIDTNGQVLNEFHYGNPVMEDGPDCNGIIGISKGIDTSYYIAGSKAAYFNQIGNCSYFSNTHVIKLDKNFNIIWEKNFGKTKCPSYASDITGTSDKSQVFLIQNWIDNNDNMYSEIVKFDFNGNILWTRKYFQGDTTEYVRARAWDIDETTDKGFILCGSIYDTTHLYPPMQAWLVKTDSLGCDGLRSCNDTALVIEVLSYPDTLCRNDTNLIHVRIKGRSAPYSLFANATLAMDSIYYPYTLPLWIDTLMPFIPQDTGWQQLVIALHEPWERRAYDSVQVYVKDCLSVVTVQNFNQFIEIFPNPAADILQIVFNGNPVNLIEIKDITSKTVKSVRIKESSEDYRLDLSEFANGVYFICFKNNGLTIENKQFVISR